MEKETKYFHVKDNESREGMITDYGLVVKLDVENWKFSCLNHPDDSLEGIDIYQNTKDVYCIEGDYSLREIKENEADEIILNQEKEWAYWQNFMSSSDDVQSPHLGKGGNFLY